MTRNEWKEHGKHACKSLSAFNFVAVGIEVVASNPVSPNRFRNRIYPTTYGTSNQKKALD
jgi:hypothetical protein